MRLCVFSFHFQNQIVQNLKENGKNRNYFVKKKMHLNSLNIQSGRLIYNNLL